VSTLLANLKKEKARKALNTLLQSCSCDGEWTYFDPVYRYYHQSFKSSGSRPRRSSWSRPSRRSRQTES
jgi:hypothetical protein